MSLVTRCPACATTFKVVRDQLRISDGWVRCGRCSEVFDANTDLHERAADGELTPAPSATTAARVADAPDPGEPTAATPPQTPEPLPASTASAAHAAPSHSDPSLAAKPIESLVPPATGRREPSLDLNMHWPAADMLDLPTRPSLPPPAAGAAAVWSSARAPGQPAAGSPVKGVVADEPWTRTDPDPWPSVDALFANDPALPSGPRESITAAPPPDAPLLVSPSPIEEAVNAQLQKALRRERVKALRQERAEEKAREREARAQVTADATANAEPPELVSVFEDDSAPVPPSFAAERPAAPKGRSSPLARALMVLLILVGLAVLALQYALHERNTLAARQPSLRPWLQQLCDATTGCQVSALRRIADITIDGASFLRANAGEGYRLLFTLRNAARVPLAMPAVELSLLDSQQRVIVRRVLMPTDFGAPPVLPPGADRSAALPIELSGAQAAALPPIAGYLVVAFYP